MSENFDIEEQLREHLLNGSEPTPPDLFGRIEEQIQGRERRKKRFFIWFWFGAGLMIITVGVLFATYNGNEADNNRTALNENQDIQDRNNEIRSESVIDVDTTSETSLNENEAAAQNRDSVNNAAPNIPNSVADNSSNTDLYQSGGNATSDADKTARSEGNTNPSINNPPAEDKTIAIVEKPSLLDKQEVNEVTQNDANTTGQSAIDKPSINNNANDTSSMLNDQNPNKASQDEANRNAIDQDQQSNENNDAGDQVPTDNTAIDNTDKDAIDTPHLLIDHNVNNTSQNEVKANTPDQDQSANENSTTDESLTDEIKTPNPLLDAITKDTSQIADETPRDTISIYPEEAAITQDSIPSIDSTNTPNGDSNSPFGIILNAGYMAYEQSVFKSYFTSGILSQTDFTSTGFEFGLGAYYRIKERFEISLLGNYGQRQTGFSYDLMISENDFFNLFENNIPIPLENIDDPTSCNCFLAENASLDYVTTTVAITLGGSYDLFKKPKYSFGPHVEFGTIASTKFTNNQSSVINFSPEIKERFTGTILGMGINLNYQISANIQLGLAPRYRFQFAQKSLIYAENVRMLFVPIQLKISL